MPSKKGMVWTRWHGAAEVPLPQSPGEFDSTVITLCLSLFPWAVCTRTKGGVKVHTMLDHDGCWPTYARLTGANWHDGCALGPHPGLPKGSVVVMALGYLDYELLGRLTREGIYFVTRLKSNLLYLVLENREVPVTKADRILSDEIIQLASDKAWNSCLCRLRRLLVRDGETGQALELVTNEEDWGADTIGAIYRDCWQIELFVKALKQHLKVKTCLGTSRTALKVQT